MVGGGNLSCRKEMHMLQEKIISIMVGSKT